METLFKLWYFGYNLKTRAKKKFFKISKSETVNQVGPHIVLAIAFIIFLLAPVLLMDKKEGEKTNIIPQTNISYLLANTDLNEAYEDIHIALEKANEEDVKNLIKDTKTIAFRAATIGHPIAANNTDTVTTNPLNAYFTDEEINLFANIIYKEARGESYECKVAIAKVIINRIYSDKFPNNLEEVLSAHGQFASYYPGMELLDLRGTEFESAILDGINSGYPENMLFFRAGYYHGGYEAYMQLNNTYFSVY